MASMPSMAFTRQHLLMFAVLAYVPSETTILAAAHQQQLDLDSQQEDTHWTFEDASPEDIADFDEQLLELSEEHAASQAARRRRRRRGLKKPAPPTGSCCTEMAAEVKMLKMRVAKLEAMMSRPPPGPRPPTKPGEKPAVKACEGKKTNDSCSFKYLPKNATIMGKCIPWQKMLVCSKAKGPYPKPPHPPNGTKPPHPGKPGQDKPIIKACADKSVGDSCTYRFPPKNATLVGNCVEWKVPPLWKSVLVCKSQRPKPPNPTRRRRRRGSRPLPTPKPDEPKPPSRLKPALEACKDKTVEERCAFKHPFKDSYLSGTCEPWESEDKKMVLYCNPKK
mmetsp:Transcript_103489/g.179696  ORF Transcript_103489/g.179696 Transcript_103489/m.179696 type:complete len:335 (+) Transcript_103489:52-1056(+)